MDSGRQRVALMERMIADFDRMAADLDQEILIEQERVGIHDPGHFAYPIYAKAAILRRDNLKRSADDFEHNLPKPRKHSSGSAWLLDANVDSAPQKLKYCCARAGGSRAVNSVIK